MNPKRSLQFLMAALVFVAAFLCSKEGNAQIRSTATTARPTTTSDSITVAAKDSVKGDIETTINYKAKDSIRFDAVNKIMHLYGDAHIDYGTTTLDAGYIQINWATSIVTAEGLRDSAGVPQLMPVFKSDADTYEATRIVYNYKTKKGKVKGAITQQGEGYIHAENIKRNNEGEIFGDHAIYTTCDLEHPHFYIKAKKMKVIPGDRVVVGAFHLVFADVPTPIGLPFGFFPSPRKRGSGIIIPTFGESRQVGYYLREGGYYWAVNDYMDMRITGDIYSLGGYGARIQSNYTKRYRYSGSFSLQHTFTKGSDNFLSSASTNEAFISPTDSRYFWVSWNHTPVSQPGKGQFSASVSAGSQFFNQVNPNAVAQTNLSVQQNFNSTVSYRKSSPNSPINYAVTISQQQQNVPRTYKNIEGGDSTVQRQVMSFTLPDVSFGVASQSPIEWFGGTLTGRWIEGIRIGYNLRAQQYVTNNLAASTRTFPFETSTRQDTILPISGQNISTLLKNARVTIQHDIPITLGTVSLFKYFKITPSVNYSESWFTKKFTYSSIAGSNRIDIDTTNGISRAYQYSGGASLTTNIYGIAQINGKKIQAIRHTITPSISYNYRPDFGDPKYGYYQWVQTDSLGNRQRLSRFEGLGGNVPGAGLSSALSFGIDNNVEMKVKTENDSTGNGFKKVSLIDRFAIRSAYNFAADSFQLSNINMDLSTRLFNSITFTASAIFDPYVYERTRTVSGNTETLTVRRTPRYVFSSGKFARLTSANFNTGFELNPQARKQQNESNAPAPTNLPSLQETVTAADYVDFNIPWTLSVQVTANFTRDNLTNKFDYVSSVGANGSVTVTDKWSMTYTTNFDVKNKTFSYTNIGIMRDLHCWQMSINWVPFGIYQSYSVNISAKASMLQDLKIRRSGSSNPYRYAY